MPTSCILVAMKANVYVDGFNLYYGCLKGTPWKWLDLLSLSRALLPADTINRIRYFTARVSSTPQNPTGHQRQDLYVRALRTLPGVTIHEGHFLVTTVRMPRAHYGGSGPRTVEVIKTEEKGSDVNLATWLLVDAFESDCDLSVLITNDSDLAEPMRVLKHRLKVRVGLVNPHHGSSSIVLRQEADFARSIRTSALQRNQFPPTLQDQHGRFTKPPTW